jgi:uncharacterized Zn finger protein (UPF0148 family)
MSEEDVYIVCPICQRFVKQETVEEAEPKIESHNNSHHDGEEVAIHCRQTVEGVEKIMSQAKDVMTDDQLNQFQNYLRNQPKVMGNFFVWNGGFDKNHDEFADFKKVVEAIKNP